MGSNLDYHLQRVPELSAPATSIVRHAQELSKIISKGGDCVLSYYAQSMTESKKKEERKKGFSNDLFAKEFCCFIPLDSRS